MRWKTAQWSIGGSFQSYRRRRIEPPASSAIGEKVLDAGYCAVLTEGIIDQLKDLAAKHGDALSLTPLNVTKQNQINAAYRAAIARLDQVDALVNNAGYGYLGAVEEGEDAEMCAVFETELFTPLNLIKTVCAARENAAKARSST
ncbi:SDR family NAD(P)-dependent oxidoreductase [Rhizobium sp. NPDC090275]|uniref:SDR family NAD(P)-dependent oxidoreductase n=1 Tax=Rhizobium sp. NPDC090275 TaxID=3364498 RepID=UPI00383B8350